jgi:glyoxylase-like metal-dependent hydrolase (beta-lactamase superfamily II)
MITRRAAIATTAAALAAPGLATKPALAQSAPPKSGQQAPGWFRYKVGDFEVTAINDGFAQRPLAGFVRNVELDQVQKALQDVFLPTDSIRIPFTTLVINTGARLVLIDSGNGQFAAPTSGRWMANFKAAGFEPDMVGAVIISHFHGDHINGLRNKDGSAVFPKAEILVPEAEWAFWMDDARMNAAPENAQGAFKNARRVFGPIAKDVTRFGWDKDVVPGIMAVRADGHTPGHTAFAVSSGAGRLLVLSDTTNTPQLFARNPDWSIMFDMDGPAAIATRRRLLDMAAAERMQTAFYHGPFPSTGHIVREGKGYRLEMLPHQSAL